MELLELLLLLLLLLPAPSLASSSLKSGRLETAAVATPSN